VVSSGSQKMRSGLWWASRVNDGARPDSRRVSHGAARLSAARMRVVARDGPRRRRLSRMEGPPAWIVLLETGGGSYGTAAGSFQRACGGRIREGKAASCTDSNLTDSALQWARVASY